MNEKFKNAFDKLDINEKRNQISNELLIIGEIIKNIENKYNIQSVLNIKNYDINKDNNLQESEMLSFLYEDIYNVERELITVLTAVLKQNKNQE